MKEIPSCYLVPDVGTGGGFSLLKMFAFVTHRPQLLIFPDTYLKNMKYSLAELSVNRVRVRTPQLAS
jgi:hypothetical protein